MSASSKKKAKNNFRLSVVTKTTKGALNQLTGAHPTLAIRARFRPGDLT